MSIKILLSSFFSSVLFCQITFIETGFSIFQTTQGNYPTTYPSTQIGGSYPQSNAQYGFQNNDTYGGYPAQQGVYPSNNIGYPTIVNPSQLGPFGPTNNTVVGYNASSGNLDFNQGININQVSPPSFNDATQKF